MTHTLFIPGVMQIFCIIQEVRQNHLLKHTLVIITKQRVSVAITIMTRIIYVCGIQKIIYEKQRKYSITAKKTLHVLRIMFMIFQFLQFCHFHYRILSLSGLIYCKYKGNNKSTNSCGLIVKDGKCMKSRKYLVTFIFLCISYIAYLTVLDKCKYMQ